VIVVVGVALIRERRVLAARRSAPPETAGRWEFPGGKRESDESDAAALIRECSEELGVVISVAELVGIAQVRPDVELRVYVGALVSGDPQTLQDHDELRWLVADDLEDIDWLPADRAVLEAVRSRL
jgi:8-oxo-dGTP diphosphatase